MRKNTPMDFWKKVEKGPGCWLWKGAKDKKGYGVFAINCKTIRASRYAWRLVRGNIRPGFLICHSCDTPSCVRPDHLFQGTYADNNEDRVRKGRFLTRGEQNNLAKLTPAKVLEIRRRSAEGERQVDLARDFGMNRDSIYKITTRRYWSHI